jgi:hypothetical protein
MACAGCCVVPADARYGPALEFAGTSLSNRPHHPHAVPARRALLDADRFQVHRSALSCEGLGLLLDPPVAGESVRVRTDAALDHQKPARRRQNPPRLRKSRRDVLPVVHGRQGPRDGHRPDASPVPDPHRSPEAPRRAAALTAVPGPQPISTTRSDSDTDARSTIRRALDAAGPSWRQTVRQQIDELDAVIARAQGAQLFLTHAQNCPTEHPARECSTMMAALDSLVAGTTVEELAARHAGSPTVHASPPGH